MKRISALRPAAALLAVSAGLFTYGTPALAPSQDPARVERRSGKAIAVSETSLGKKPPGFVLYSLEVSPDGNHIAHVINHGSTKSVVLDGREGKAYPDIPEQRPTERGRDPQIRFSPDGKRIAYVAHTPPGYFVVVDGVEGKAFDRISAGAPVFSPDSRRVAYIAQRDSKETVVVDGVPDPPCSYVAALPIRFSPDSKHIAYPARRGDSTVAVMDGKDIDRGEQIGFVRFSNDGRRYAYTVLNGDTRRVVVDGTSSKPYTQVGNDIFFSADSKHVLYRATGTGGDFIVADGQEGKYRGIIRENDYDFSPGGKPVYLVDRGPGEFYVVIGQDLSGPYDRVVGMPRFSPDGARCAFEVSDNGKYAVVTDGARGPIFDSIETLAFGPRGNHLLYTASAAGKQYLVLDGIRTEYDAVAGAIFSPDGEHVALAVKTGRRWLVSTDGSMSGPCDSQASGLVLAWGGKHLAFVCQRSNKQVAVIDGVEGKACDRVDHLGFSASGAAAYIANRNGKEVLVINAAEIAEFDTLLTPLIFDGPASLHFLATRAGEFLREEIKLDK